MRKLIQTAAFCGLAATAAWGADGSAVKTLYPSKCKLCHGSEGQGNAGMAKALKVEIRDLGSPDVQKKTDAELKKGLTEGVGKMKPIAGLSDGDVDKLIAFMRGLKKS